MRLASRWFPQNRVALIIGLIVTVGMSGGIIAQSPFELLIHAVGGWRNAMLINAGCGLLITFLMIIFIKDSPDEFDAKESAQPKQENFFHSIMQSCANKQNWLTGVYNGLINLPLPVLGALWGNLYLVQGCRYSAIEAGNLLSLIFVGLIFGSTVNGWISDKLGRRKLPMAICAVGILISALLIIYFNESIYLLAILLFLLGFFSGAQSISYPLTIESNASNIESTSLSLVSILTNVIGASAQIFLGWLINLNWNGMLVNGTPLYTLENFKFALAMLPIGFIICIVMALSVRETFNKRREAIK